MRIKIFKRISDDTWEADINRFLEKLTDKSPKIWTERTRIFSKQANPMDDQLRVFIAYETFKESRGLSNLDVEGKL